MWAELKAPDIVAVPIERETAAVTLCPGAQVKLRGVWRTVCSVRGERSVTGGTTDPQCEWTLPSC